jgi:type IV secretory pathway VirB4 component
MPLSNPFKKAAPSSNGKLGQRGQTADDLLINLDEDSLVDALAPGAMDFTRDDCVSFSATEWLRIWYVRNWPRELSYEYWADLLRFPGDVRVSLFMEPIPPGMVTKQLEQAETHIQSKRFLRMYQRRDPSPSEDRRLQEIKEERQLIEIGQDPFYYFTVVIGLYAESEAALDRWSAELELKCRNIGLTLDRAKWDQEAGLNALLPYNMNTLGDRRRNARVDSLVAAFPWLGDEIVMPDGIFYGYDMQTGMAAVLDPFKLENPNCVIIGTSGGGKSYWMKDTIEQYVLDGVRVFVLDIENEYRHLCDDLGGLYLDMGIESQHKINVLDPDPNDPDGLAGAFENLKGWFVTVIGRAFMPEEEEVLDKAYFAAFVKRGIVSQDRTTLTLTPPVLSDLYAALNDVAQQDVNGAHARRLASALYPLALGGGAAAFNQPTDVDVRSNPLVVFGLSTVHRSMMSKRIRQIQQFTWSQMTRQDRTIEIVDEAWWLLENPETADDLCARARRFRKKNAALFVATQHPEDFAANRHAHAILSIVGTHLLFQQNDSVINQIADIFKLNPIEKSAIARLEPGHYFLKTSKLRMLLYRPIVRSRHPLYTTRPEEMKG